MRGLYFWGLMRLTGQQDAQLKMEIGGKVNRASRIISLFLVLALLGVLGGCGGSVGTSNTNVTPPTLVSVGVTPPAASLGVASSQQFLATGVYSDHSTKNLTASVTWTSSNNAVASISNVAGSNGLASTLTPGSTSITAELDGITSPPVSLTVTPATLVSVGVTPAAKTLGVASVQQFVATGVYSDNTTKNLTANVTWSSSNNAVASISNVAGSNGLASTLTPGSTSITAEFDGITSPPVSLTVTPATLVAIDITPATPSVVAGTTQQFTATGVYSDNTTQELTGSVSWNSSDTAVATISNAAGSKGLASTVTQGSSNITAAFNGISAPAVTLTVTPATLVSIAVTPSVASVPAGLTQQFMATGTYSDGSTQNLTAITTWSSSASGVASISNASGSSGLVSALTPGSTAVTAALNGITSPAATLSVTSATLQSIAVTPSVVSVAAGFTQQFTATGTYSDGSTQNLTATAAWKSATAGVATISNATGSNGLASALTPGTTAVTAGVNGINSPAATLKVTPAVLVSIGVTPTAPTVAAGRTEQFTATGTYSDKSTLNLTASATWSSSAPTVATISNESGSNGLATTVAAGNSAVSATLDGITSPAATLTVVAAGSGTIIVQPPTYTLDTTGIGKAMADCVNTPNCGTVQLIAGTYTVNSQITAQSNLTLTGAGKGVTLLQGHVKSGPVLIHASATPLTAFTLSNLSFDLQHGLNASGVHLSNVSLSTVSNISFTNTGASADNPTGADNGWFMTFGAYPDAQTSAVENFDNTISNVDFSNHGGTLEALLIWNSYNTTITSPTLTNISSPGIGLWQQDYNTTISGARCSASSGNAIYYSITVNNTTINDFEATDCANGIAGANISNYGTYGCSQAVGLYVTDPIISGGSHSTQGVGINLSRINGAFVTNPTISGHAIGIRLDDGNAAGYDPPTNWTVLGGTIFDNNAPNSLPALHPGILFSGAITAPQNGLIENVSFAQPAGDTATATQKYPIVFDGSSVAGGNVYSGVQIQSNNLQPGTGGTSVFLNGTSANPTTLANTLICGNSNYVGTSPGQSCTSGTAATPWSPLPPTAYCPQAPTDPYATAHIHLRAQREPQ